MLLFFLALSVGKYDGNEYVSLAQGCQLFASIQALALGLIALIAVVTLHMLGGDLAIVWYYRKRPPLHRALCGALLGFVVSAPWAAFLFCSFNLAAVGKLPQDGSYFAAHWALSAVAWVYVACSVALGAYTSYDGYEGAGLMQAIDGRSAGGREVSGMLRSARRSRSAFAGSRIHS